MKRLFYLTIAIFIVACSSPTSYQITGELRGVKNGKVFILEYKGHSKYASLDSAVIRDGEFILEGSVKCPKRIILGTNINRIKTGFWIENSKIFLDAHIDSLQQAIIKGSRSQLEYLKIREFLFPYEQKYRELYSVLSKKKANQSDPEEIKMAEKAVQDCWQEKVEAIIEYIKTNPSSYPAASLIRSIISALSWQEIEKTISYLDPEVAKSEEILKYKNLIEVLKVVDVGKKAPDFSMNDPEGNAVRLYDVLAANKLVLLDFWASWCGPCRRENPNLVSVYEQYQSQGFHILGVSLDKEKDKWIQAIQKDGLNWTHVSSLTHWDNPVVAEYGISFVPSNILIDASGTILGRNLKGDELKNKIRMFFLNK